MPENPIQENDEFSPLEKPIITSAKKEPKPKTRKPKTQGQLEQFEKIRLKRLDMINEKNEKKRVEASLLLLKHGYVKKEELENSQDSLAKESSPAPKKMSVVKSQKEESESDTEPEVIVIKKKKKPKKTIIIEESESSDSDTPPQKPVIKQRPMVSQQNKKSVIKVHTPQTFNYFVD